MHKATLKSFGVFLLSILVSFSLSLPVEAALININTALSAELQTLTGIGPVYAQRIIDYRTQNGPFQKVEDIKNVSGIGEATFNKIKDQITVGELSPPADDKKEKENATTTEETPPVATLQSSAHFSSGSITTNEEKIVYKVGAGRDRVATVGTPIQFKATHNIETPRIAIVWSFGDGSVGYGETILHAYSYPGEYVVVVSADSPEGKVVSRVNVKIVPDTLAVTHISPQRIEITNSGKTEINLYGRKLVSKDQAFVFSEDTIIKAGQKVSFPSTITKIIPETSVGVAITLVNENKIVGTLDASVINNLNKEKEKEKEKEIIEQVLSLQRKQIELEKRRIEEAPKQTQPATVVLVDNKLATSTPSSSFKNSNGWVGTLKRFFGFK